MRRRAKYALTILLLALLSSNCEEAQYIVGFGVYSAVVGGASFTMTVEAQKKACDSKETRDEQCKCWAEKLSAVSTPRKCWLVDGKYMFPP